MAKKKSSAYWKKRFSDLENAQNQYGQQTFHQIEPAFDRAQGQVQAQIESWYQRYADNNGITMAAARRQLTGLELKELKWDVQDYIKYGKENALDGRWMQELENASAKYHISRLEALQLRSQQALEVAFGNETDAVDFMMKELYQSGYYHTCFEVQNGFNIGWEIGQIDERKLQKVISKPWGVDGKNFSDRIWTSKTQMVGELHQQLTRAIIQGKSPDEAIKAMTQFLNDKTKNAKGKAGRLVMTEQAYISSAAQKDAFNDLDVEEFEIVATLDSHTSDICQDMDGKHFPMKDFEPGITAPPFHPWCRSTTVPYFDDEWSGGERAARGEDGKTYYVPSDMTYKEWKQSLVDGQTDDLKVIEPPEFKEVTDAIDFQYGNHTDKEFYEWEDNYEKHNSNVKLSDDELKLIEDYTEGGYIGFNEVSRFDDATLKGKQYNAYTDEDIKRIRTKADMLENTLSKFDLDTDIVTHRFERDVSWLTGKGNDVADLEALIGTEYTAKGFTSSGMNANRFRFTGGKSDAVHFEIVTPKGTDGAYLSMSKKGEHEFLYNRNTKFKVLDGGERIVKEMKYDFNTGKYIEVDVKERFLKVQVIPKSLTPASSSNILKVKKAKDAADFNALSNYLNSTYGIKMDDAVKKLDFDAVKDTISGAESVISEYPDVGALLEKAVVSKSGVMSCSGDELSFHPSYFSDKQKLLDMCEERAAIGYWLPNTSPASIGVHEAAHGVEWALIESNKSYASDFEKIFAWNESHEAKTIVSQACRNIKKTAYGKGKANAELIRSISQYASIDASEAMAEAFADVYINGVNANPLSIEIKQLTDKQMKKYKGVT